jgi:hypothetical protein
MSRAPHREPRAHPRFIRPYVLTRGRTQASGPVLALEANVTATDRADDLVAGTTPEARRIVELCRPPMSLAELAARLLLPIGVVRVLVGDLLVARALVVDEAAPADPGTDVRLLQRLLDGIRAL